MSDRFVVVVGDEYTLFAQNPNVVGVSTLCNKMRARALCPDTIIIGQGVDLTTRATLSSLAAEAGIEDRIVWPEEEVPLALTHKKDIDNIMISGGRLVAPKTYEFGLLIGGQMDRLSDHVTGQHIGAMLLIEACRQACIFVLESEYSVASSTRWSYLLNAFSATFESYVFPLPTVLTARFEETQERKPSQIQGRLDVSLSQASKVVCGMSFTVSLHQAELMAKIETKRARQAIDGVGLTFAPLADAAVSRQSRANAFDSGALLDAE